MKKPSTDLFDLIKSLSAQEARHFKKNLRLQDSQSLRLFQQIEQAIAYDEAQIQQAAMPEANANQFSVAKHYLYHTLLLFLLQREQQDIAAWQIRTRLQTLELLYKRELFGQCEGLLKSVERAVRQIDDPSLIKEVLLWKLKLADRLHHKVSPDEFQQLGHEFLGNAQRDLELSRQQWAYHDFFFRLRSGGVLATVSSIQADYQARFEQGIVHSHPDTSLAAQLPYAHAYATYAFMCGDYGAAYQAHRWIMDTMERNAGWLALRPDIYLDSSFRLGIMAMEEAKFDEAKVIIAKIQKLKHQAGQEGRRFFYESQLVRALHLVRGDWSTLARLIERLEADFEAHRHRLSTPELIVFRMNNAMALLNLEHLAAARRRLVDVMNADLLQGNPDFELICKLLLVLIAEQDRDAQQFRFWYRTLYRQLHGRPAYALEMLMLKHVRRVFAAKTLAIKTEVWGKLLSAMQESKHLGSRAIYYFDVLSWVRSKAENRPFEEVFKERVQSEIEVKLAEKGDVTGRNGRLD